MINLSFRITLEQFANPQLLQNYCDHYAMHIHMYIKDKLGNPSILHSTMGLHMEAKAPHIHYHMILEDYKLPANPNQSWKYYWKKKELLAHSPCVTPMVYHEKDSKTINIAIKHQATVPHHVCSKTGDDIFDISTTKFLAYPLKELRDIEDYCINVNIKALKEFANSLYIESKARWAKKEEAKNDKLSKYEAFCYHMDEKCCEEFSIADTYGKIRLHFKNIESSVFIPFCTITTDAYYFSMISSADAKEHIHPKQIVHNLEKYLFANGHYSTERHFRF